MERIAFILGDQFYYWSSSVLTLAAGTWILGRIWYVGFLFPAFFALPISTVTRRAMGKAGLLPEEDDE